VRPPAWIGPEAFCQRGSATRQSRPIFVIAPLVLGCSLPPSLPYICHEFSPRSSWARSSSRLAIDARHKLAVLIGAFELG
jgi:hypothetical protein